MTTPKVKGVRKSPLEIAREIITDGDRVAYLSKADRWRNLIVDAIESDRQAQDEQIARQSSEIVILQQANYVLGEEIKDDQEQIARLTAERDLLIESAKELQQAHIYVHVIEEQRPYWEKLNEALSNLQSKQNP